MRVLVVGAGIAGDALAVLLGRRGYEVEVVELAPSLRSGGQTVDLRGASAHVLQEMGLLERARQVLVPQRGVAWVDAQGGALARMPVEFLGGRAFVSTEELLRSDLARVLHEACGTQVQHRFGDTVESVEDGSAGVRVAFRSGGTAQYDLVVGADGTHSRVRSLLLGPEEQFRRELGLAHAWFTLTETPTTPVLDGWWLMHHAPGCRQVAVRPGRPGQQQAGFTFPADGAPDRRDRAAQLDHLDTVFADVGWRAPELLRAALTTEDLAADTLDQVLVPRWHTERVVLLGDAAWCASPLGGMGTALALVGARTLDRALALVDTGETSLLSALERYQAAMTPQVQAAQQMFPGRVRFAAPRTHCGIRSAALVVRALQVGPVAALLERGAQRSDWVPSELPAA